MAATQHFRVPSYAGGRVDRHCIDTENVGWWDDRGVPENHGSLQSRWCPQVVLGTTLQQRRGVDLPGLLRESASVLFLDCDGLLQLCRSLKASGQEGAN